MTFRTPAAAVAPDLRYAAAGLLADSFASVTAFGAVVRAEGCLPSSPSIPRYLRYADRDAVLIAEGLCGREELEAWLAGQIRAAASPDGLGQLGAAVIALDAADRCFREHGLWAGNIYLAGAEALTALLALAGTSHTAGQWPQVRPAGNAACAADHEPGDTVRELAALELAYLFPIARKFRSGAYDGQVQYRLNGWGRTLAQRLTTTPAGAAHARTCHDAITAHLTDERQRYAAFLAGLDVARQDYAADQLGRALALPVPVLI
jgi:hypothetical protein